MLEIHFFQINNKNYMQKSINCMVEPESTLKIGKDQGKRETNKITLKLLPKTKNKKNKSKDFEDA